jgi:hypothetical protein
MAIAIFIYSCLLYELPHCLFTFDFYLLLFSSILVAIDEAREGMPCDLISKKFNFLLANSLSLSL